MKLRLVLTTVLIVLTKCLFAYSIPTPKSLRKMVIKSELIVYANVIEIVDLDHNNLLGKAKAILVIDEILQGKVRKDTIEVLFDQYIICPSPARYVRGKKTLAFLYKNKRSYSTHGRAEGAKTLNKAEFDIYKQRILELQAILLIKNKEKKLAKTTDWIISCAANPITREEGLYDLSTYSDFMFDYNSEKKEYIAKHRLNRAQKSIVREIFFTANYLSSFDVGLIDVLAIENDTELIDFLSNWLQSRENEFDFNRYLVMEKVAKYSNRKDLNIIMKLFKEINFREENSVEKSDKLIKEYLRIL